MFKMFLLFAPLVLSLGNLDFIQYWDQIIRIDISTEAVVISMNETEQLLLVNNYKEDYCYDVFLDNICTVPEKGCIGRRVTSSSSPGYETASISKTLLRGIIYNLIEKTGDKYYMKGPNVVKLPCVPARKMYQNEGVIVPRFIQTRVDVGPMYHYYKVEFKSSRRIPSKYTERNIQNSFSNGNGKGNIVYTIREFAVDETQSSSPKLIFQN
ncbi:hypothetical protein HDV06_001807 [Boothiomyces sp. JEL0866]|nr:hypothetical protein HDV06_001807 [Boothiomyces sp. JEL0866]